MPGSAQDTRQTEELSSREIYLVNHQVDVRTILRQMGVEVEKTAAILCPFHGDSKRSAKYFEDSNELYCWTCSKTYRAYDMLRFLGFPSNEIKKNLRENQIKPIVRRKKSILPDEDEGKRLKAQFMAGKISAADLSRQLITSILEGQQ